MGPNSAMMNAAAMGGSVAPGENDSLGKLFIASQALSGLASLAGGFMGMKSASDEARLLESQADIARQEAEVDAAAKARDVRRFQADQAHKYAASGITLEGSPVLVLEETLRLGQQEVDAIIRRGKANMDLLKQKARITKSGGRNAFLSSILTTGAQGMEAYVMGKRLGVFNKTAKDTGSKPSVLESSGPVLYQNNDPLADLIKRRGR
jgi:hypothetical protein